MAKVNDVIKSINKEANKTVVSRLDEQEVLVDHPRIPTGILSVDDALYGGLPLGRIVDVYGPEGSGKSAIMYHFAANAQKHGSVVWVDAERAFDPRIANASGINLNDLIVPEAMSAERTFELIEKFALAEDCSAVIVDSFAGLVPEAELAGDIGDAHVGLMGRIASQSLRRLTTWQDQEDAKCIVAFVNQLRANIGAVGNAPKTTVTGGKAVKFYASVRMNVTRIQNLTKGEDVIGQRVQVKFDKSRLARPFAKATFDLFYDRGISNDAGLGDAAVERGLLVKSGNWFVDPHTGDKLANGRNNLLNFFDENPDYADALRERILTG